MNTRPYSILLLLLISVVPFAHADELTLTGPGSLAPFTPFTIHAGLPGIDTFTRATMKLDGSLLATCYPTGACLIPAEEGGEVEYGIKDTAPASTGGLVVLLTHRGLDIGTHTLTISTEGTTNESQSLEVKVDKALDAASIKEIQANQVDVEARLLSAEKKIGEYTQTLSELQGKIDQGNQARTELNDQLQAAKADLAAAQQTISEIRTQVEGVKGDLGLTLKNPFASTTTPENPSPSVSSEISSSPTTGFATGGNAPLIGMGVLIGIAGLVFYFTRLRKRKGMGSGGGMAPKTPFFEGSMDSLFKGLPGGTNADKPEVQPRKWSSGEAGLRADIENNPPEKINFGDLVKQERD